MKENTTDPNKIQRKKTSKTLLHSPKLQERIASQIKDFGGVIMYDFEKDRLDRVIHMLAYGHLAYENDTLSWDSIPCLNVGAIGYVRTTKALFF